MTSPIKIHPHLLLATLLAAIAAPVISLAAPSSIVEEGFEGDRVPSAARPFNVALATDATRAHSGASSLRVTPKKGYATVFFDLDDDLDFSKDCEFSFWVYSEKANSVSAYISADDGSSGRYTVTNALGTVEAGKWCEFRGTARAADWRKWDSLFRLVIKPSAPCWVDDIVIANAGPAVLPSQTWSRLEKALHAAAGKRATALKPGAAVALDATHAALAPDSADVETTLPAEATAIIPAEGLLVFAIDAKADLDVTGSLELHHDTPAPGAAAPDSSFVIRNSSLGGEAALDLRPGLRVTVLSGNTVIAAPGVKAPAWRGTKADGDRPGPAPDIRGERPSATVPLAPFRLTKGRHYLTIAGPHFRSAGTFAKLELRAKDRPAEKPIQTFGFFSDTHLGFGRSNWMNFKLNARSGEELEAALRQLKREGADFAILGGDMTDGGRASQYKDLDSVVKRAGLPVYGCIGNHDTFVDSRADVAKIIPKLFPSGPENTDYAFSPKKLPLRFIVLDGSYWRDKDGKIHDYKAKGADNTTYRAGMHDWLRKTLAEDTKTPTLVVSHYPFYLRRGVSPVSGYDLGKTSLDRKTVALLDATPNVVATLNGHLHCNEAATRNGITYLQNPAFVEWPNAYRVFRVYKDRIEWEVRQFPNRGLIREGVIPEKALLYMLSTADGDLAGTISLAPRTPVVETAPAAPGGPLVDESFEAAALPANLATQGVNAAIDPARAHTGKSSLRVAKKPGADYNIIAYDLDGRLDFSRDYEFTYWIYVEPGAKINSYVSAKIAGVKDRQAITGFSGKTEPGKWCKLAATIPASKWNANQSNIRFIVRLNQGDACWIDDVSIRAVGGAASNAGGKLIDESFEGGSLSAAKPWRLTRANDTARARTGQSSLRLAPTTAEWGTFAFELDKLMDFQSGCEFSVWIYAEPGARVTSYVSAQAPGAKDRHTIANAAGKIEPGKWCRLSGKIPASKWRQGDRDIRFIVRAYGPCWIDDATLSLTP